MSTNFENRRYTLLGSGAVPDHRPIEPATAGARQYVQGGKVDRKRETGRG